MHKEGAYVWYRPRDDALKLLGNGTRFTSSVEATSYSPTTLDGSQILGNLRHTKISYGHLHPANRTGRS